MRAKLDLSAGLVMAEAVSIALGRKLGKAAAHRLLERAAKQAIAGGTALRAAIEANAEIAPHFDAAELDALFAPENHLGVAPDFARRAAASWRAC
jgi:3-carboxy-cis,cis-muconate cycloisomerase